jgi:hypothetical protein
MVRCVAAVGDGPAAPHHFAVDVHIARAAFHDKAAVAVRLQDIAVEGFSCDEAAQVIARGLVEGRN